MSIERNKYNEYQNARTALAAMVSSGVFPAEKVGEAIGEASYNLSRGARPVEYAVNTLGMSIRSWRKSAKSMSRKGLVERTKIESIGEADNLHGKSFKKFNSNVIFTTQKYGDEFFDRTGATSRVTIPISWNKKIGKAGLSVTHRTGGLAFVIQADQRQSDHLADEGVDLYDAVYFYPTRIENPRGGWPRKIYEPVFEFGYLLKRGDVLFANENYGKAKAGFDRLVASSVMGSLG